jgi:hypothetical protein
LFDNPYTSVTVLNGSVLRKVSLNRLFDDSPKPFYHLQPVYLLAIDSAAFFTLSDGIFDELSDVVTMYTRR